MASNKYFLDPNGVPTQRMAGRAGAGHIEIAMATEKLDPDSDIYQLMFGLGYVRGVETETEVQVDTPKALTRGQRRFLDEKEKEGKRVVINDAGFVGSRQERRDGPT